MRAQPRIGQAWHPSSSLYRKRKLWPLAVTVLVSSVAPDFQNSSRGNFLLSERNPASFSRVTSTSSGYTTEGFPPTRAGCSFSFALHGFTTDASATGPPEPLMSDRNQPV